jgi:hypothetical protein
MLQKASLIDNARLIIYNQNMFIIQATGPDVIKLVKSKIYDFLKLVFVPSKPIRPGLMFASKPKSYPIEVYGRLLVLALPQTLD